MKYSVLISFLCSFVIITSCNAQNKTHTKVHKNHFYQYPDEFFFMQCGLQDKNGNMWFGSAGDGIYFYDQKTKLFSNFTANDGLCHNDILCCMEDKEGIIWFGTRNGLIRYKPSGEEPTKNDFTSLLVSRNIINKSTREKIPYSYKPADNFVWSFMQDKSGKIWVSTNNGVYVHNPSADYDGNIPLFIRFLNNDSIVNNENLHLESVQSMVEDNKGRIWFVSPWVAGGGEGICRFDQTTNQLVNFKPDSILSFRTIMKTHNGHLFFLNPFYGIYLYNEIAEQKGEFPFSNFSNKIGLTKDTIMTMHEDNAGNLWFGCNSTNMKNGGEGGLWRYSPSAQYKGQKALQLFTTKDGLSHNCVFCIVKEQNGNLWFGTRFTGLCRYDGKSFTDFTER